MSLVKANIDSVLLARHTEAGDRGGLRRTMLDCAASFAVGKIGPNGILAIARSTIASSQSPSMRNRPAKYQQDPVEGPMPANGA
jgi:hypothetical protein